MTETPPVIRRLFVALPVPSNAAAHLMNLPRKGIDAAWTSAGDLHITIRFLGEVEDGALPPIRAALANVRRPPFHIDIRGLGFFDNDRHAVLHAHIESTRKLTTLCAEITDRLTPLGFNFGPRPFVPHITLARVHNPRGLETYIQRQSGLQAHWLTTSFDLMQSGGGEAGRQYKTLDRYNLID